MQPEVTVVIIAHKDRDLTIKRIKWFIDNQFKFPIEVLVYYSGMGYMDITPYDYIKSYNQPDRNDWGHEKVQHGLNAANGMYTCFMNMDDEYDLFFLPEMFESLRDGEHEVAYCNYTAKDGTEVITEPKIGSVTRGCIMVDSYFARSVGYNHRDYGADGKFVEELIAAGAKTVHVNKNLYTHK